MSERWVVPEVCPVCLSLRVIHFLRVNTQCYWRCQRCEATFLDPQQHPDARTERAEYAFHENRPDPGYLRFLERVLTPLRDRLQAGAEGLDYGCGPGPVLMQQLQADGFRMAGYDPFFAPDTTLLARTYDFVTCTEVVEHFHHPAREFARLQGLVRPGGWLAIMTCFQTDDSRFAQWHYRRDPTHVVFYRDSTFRYLASRWEWHIEIPTKDVVLLRKLDA